MEPADYSDYLDGLQSLDQVSNWLDDQLQPGGDSLSSERRSVSVANTSSNTQRGGIDPKDEADNDNDGEDFKNKSKPTNTRGGNKRKAATADAPDKYARLVSKSNKLSLTWNASNTSLAVFKEAVLEVLRVLEPDQVFRLADKQEKENNLCWYAIIPYGGQFIEKNQTVLDNSKIFARFLEVAEAKGEAKVYLVQNDPKTIAERNEALKQLSEQDKENNDDQSAQAEATAGASFNKQVIENMWLLRATHMPSEKLTGSMELPVMIDPDDPKRFIALSPDRITLWARAMATNPEVTVDNPPKSPAFRFQTKAEFKGIAGAEEEGENSINVGARTTQDSPSVPRTPGSNRSPGGIASAAGSTMSPIQMAMGAYPPAMSWPPASPWGWGPPNPNFYVPYGGMPGETPPGWQPNPFITHNPHLAAGTMNTGPVSSPPASDDTVDINDYLSFCHIDHHCESVQKALVDYGITHYQEFENIKPEELESFGVKKSKARLLVSNTKKYGRTLKKRRLNK
ncbi:uncharacterized protein PGTG_10152 [Puccinia graminis f. sp. tritici CRL 75-36-700-3]|uniref:SAM domain-containing protein n=1 Tax=Puccinia graminis f. sp. tritici (strain CRL 75-36-700-3 / race SCCL) TaxID=418459 RepID=E3KJF7_PUCGT|nr:uncharacterized protein PGTG_10152 [Puccinia graminis f. sp. tritici CRL 75-36-700-3]EFP84432.2 hypothetical protein PGTG_10152 [Puccinia graminis f. sp. tritici CRL 75-36-700-3]